MQMKEYLRAKFNSSYVNETFFQAMKKHPLILFRCSPESVSLHQCLHQFAYETPMCWFSGRWLCLSPISGQFLQWCGREYSHLWHIPFSHTAVTSSLSTILLTKKYLVKPKTSAHTNKIYLMFTKTALQDPDESSESWKRDEINPLTLVSNPRVHYCVLIPWKITIYAVHLWRVDVWMRRKFVCNTQSTNHDP